MAALPTDPIYSKLLITSLKPEYIQISHMVTAIVAMLSVENIYFTPQFANEQELQKKRAKILSSDSDHISLWKIYMQFEANLKFKGKATAKRFCEEFSLNEKSL